MQGIHIIVNLIVLQICNNKIENELRMIEIK